MRIRPLEDSSCEVVWSSRAFSLIELVVVLGIASLVVALLMPALAQARRHADQVRCQTQLREVGLALQMYQNTNGGWLFPLTVHPTTRKPHGLGLNRPPHLRWPMLAFQMPGAPDPPPYDAATYDRLVYDPITFDPTPYTPAVLRCPSDLDPMEGHSYFLNIFLPQRGVMAGGGQLNGKSSSEVILMGEKYSDQRDLFVESAREFDRIADLFRHGIKHFSNYLYLDSHVAPASPQDARAGLDPWGETLRIDTQAPAQP